MQGTTWTLTAFVEGDQRTAPLPTDVPLTLRVHDDRLILTFDGVNGVTYEYQTNGDGDLRLTPMAGTSVGAIDSALDEQSTRLGERLTRVTSYTVEDSVLTLLTPDGAALEYTKS